MVQALKEIVDGVDNQEDQSILTYVGDMHVDPIQRLWDNSGRKVKTQYGRTKISDSRLNFAKMMYLYRPENKETADE